MKKYLFITGIFTLLNYSLLAQSLSISLWRDSINVPIAQTFVNRITVHNKSQQKQEISVAIQIPAVVQLLSTIPERIELLPDQSIMIPIKGLVTSQATSSIAPFIIRFDDSSKRIIKQASFTVLIEGKTQPAVTLYAPEETIVLFDPGQPARIPLRIVHNQAKPATFTIDARSLPEGVDQTAFPLLLKLVANQDTTLTIQVKSTHRWTTREPYQLIVSVRDQQKAIAGTLIYKLVIAIDNKRYKEAAFNSQGGYGASTALSWLNTNQLAKEIRVWGTDSIGKAQLDFHIDYLNYGDNQLQQLQNSFVSLRTKQAMIQLGTSYDYHELPLFGRGLKAVVGQRDRQWTLWAINANPNWLSPYDNVWAGTILSARYDRQLPLIPGGRFSVSSNYFTQVNTMRSGYLNFASFRYDKSERHSLEVLGGQSIEFAKQGPEQAKTWGWAGQLNYSYQSEKINWQIRTYFSNPVYSGLQKGASLVYSQFFWRPQPNTSIIARINHMGYDRIMFSSPIEYTRSKFSNTIAEISVGQRIRQLNVNLRPYWMSQQDITNPVSQRADAYRLASTLSYTLRGGQHLDFSYDAGLFVDQSTVRPQAGWLSQRIISTIVTKTFSFWGYLQKGPYFLFDLRNDHPEKMMTASLTPTVDFSLLERRLAGTIGLNYLYDAASDQTRYIAVGRLQYDILPDLSIQLSGNGTPYSPRPELAYSLYRMEVIKRFNKAREKHNGQLRLSFFEDANGNNLKDSNERWIDSLLVTINENTFMTNTHGTVSYKHIPPGDYHISAISANRISDPILYHERITVSRLVDKQIPIARTFRVKGQLRCQTNAYDRQPCQFDRFSIEIQQNNKPISSTSPLPDGTFAVHLPPGKYTMVVHDYGRQPHVIIKTTTLTLNEEGNYPELNWVVDGSTRSIEIKRFSPK